MFYYQATVKIRTTKETKKGLPKDVFRKEVYIVKAESVSDAETKVEASYKNSEDIEVISVKGLKIAGVITSVSK